MPVTLDPQADAVPPQPSALFAKAAQALSRHGIWRFVRALIPTAASLAIQFAAFAITARGLGIEEFGRYAVILGLAAIGLELVGLGGADLLVRGVSRDRSQAGPLFGQMLTLIALSLPVVTLLGWWIATAHLESSIAPSLILVAIAGELLIGRIASSTELMMVAHGDTFLAACVRFCTAFVRFLTAAIYFSLGKLLEGWILAAFAQALLLSIIYVGLAAYRYGRPRFSLKFQHWRDGLAFSANQTARASQSNLDRVILSKFATDAVLGAYSAGSRFLQLGLFPLQVVTRILYPNFFVHGEKGIGAARAYAVRCLPALLAAGIGGGLAVAVAGYFAPTILGQEFAASRHFSMLLSLCMPFIALQYLAADTLTGAGFQHIRAVVFGVAAIAFGLIMASGAALGGVNGVLAALIGAHAILAAILWAIAWSIQDDKATI
ncbi:MAG: lipopolysaccharide biosynthesis protein [Caulobacterales bacterium]